MPGARAPEQERRQQIVAAALAVAARDRLDGLTMRRVAAEASLSPGLLFFHFTDKDTLLLAVLEALVERTVPSGPHPHPDPMASPRDRLLHHVRTELTRLRQDRDLVELFFDFWVRGTRHPGVRERIAAALADYRRALEPLAGDVIADEAGRFVGVTVQHLAGLVVAFLQGHAVQAVLDPETGDPAAFMATLEALVPEGPASSRRG